MNHIAVWLCKRGVNDPVRVKELEYGSVNEIAERFPEGVYTTLRTFQQDHTLYLDHHFDRLEESSKLVGTEIRIDRKDLRHKLRVAIKYTNFSETKLRIHISLPKTKKPETYLILEPLTTPSADEISMGAAIMTRKTHRNNAFAKTSGFLPIADGIRKQLPKEINEVLMIGDDNVCLEGLSSNFYGIDQSVIWTADEGVLHGITREVVLDVIRKEQLQVERTGYPFMKVYQLDEAFITSTSRGVLPITWINHQKIGTGLPGPVTEVIRKAFDKKIQTLIERI